MQGRIKQSGLPRALCRSEAATRAFRSLPAGEKESFAAAFSAVRHGADEVSSAESRPFMQNTQNPYGILH